MARSYNSRRGSYYCSTSDKWHRTKANRAVRRAVHVALHVARTCGATGAAARPLPLLREKSNVYDFAKDGFKW